MQLGSSYSGAVQSVKQLSVVGKSGVQGATNLVFVYPVVIDASVKKYSKLMRAFFVVDAMSTIKSNNLLKIMSDVTGGNMASSGIENPAMKIRDAIYSVATDNKPGPVTINFAQNQLSDNYAYKDFINRNTGFIINQIENDPKYKQLDPIISSITIEHNLVSIPLILGTKEYPFDTGHLYFCLLIGLANGLTLDNQSSLDRISRSFDALPQDNARSYIFNKELQKRIMEDIDPDLNNNEYIDETLRNVIRAAGRVAATGTVIGSKALAKGTYHATKGAVKVPISLAKNLQKQIEKDKYRQTVLRDRGRLQFQSQSGLFYGTFKKLLKLSEWGIEVGGLETRGGISLNDVTRIETRMQGRIYNNALSSYNSYIANIIPNISYDVEQILGPIPTFIDVPLKVSTLINSLAQKTQSTFLAMSSHIVTALHDTNIQADARIKNAEQKISYIYAMSEENKLIGSDVLKNLQKLDSVNLKGIVTPSNIEEFARVLNNISQSFQAHTNTYESWLTYICHGDVGDDQPGTDRQMTSLLTRTKTDIAQSIHDFIFTEYPRGNRSLFDQFYLYPGRAVMDDNTQLLNTSNLRYSYIANIAPGITWGELKSIITEIYDAIKNIIYFLLLYNFFSYTCEFITDIDIDIQTQKREALDFPNYIMIVSASIIKSIYFLNRANSFRLLVNSEKETNLPQQVQDTLNVSSTDMKKIIQYVARRLRIPNIIVIDESDRKVYYRFMYMEEVNKLGIDSITSYVEHQKEALRNNM